LTSSNGAASTKLQAALALFNVNNPSGGGFNDGAAFNPTGAALQSSGNAFFENLLTTFPTGGTAAYMLKASELSREALTDASGNLYVALQALNAYTPASAETFILNVKGTY
jgi:hypothetical protein